MAQMNKQLFVLVLLLIVQCTVWHVASPVFLTGANLLNVITSSTTIALLAIGASFIMGAGGIDLSVGSVVALATVGAVIGGGASDNTGVYLVGALVSGALIGALNGTLIAFLRLPPFIATLATLSLARGIALILVNGRPHYGLPAGVIALGQGIYGGIPAPVYVLGVVGIVATVLLNATPFGRYALCMGDNIAAVRNAGVRVRRLTIVLYLLSSTLAAIAGVVTMARVNAADPTFGIMYELTAITAAVIGGASLRGGQASVIGALMGAVTLGVLQNGLTLVDMPAYYQQLATGVVLIVAVGIAQMRRGRIRC